MYRTQRMTCRSRPTWWVLMPLVALILTNAAFSDGELPRDYELDAKVGAVIQSLAIAPALGSMMLPTLELRLHYWQSCMAQYKLFRQDAERTAWTQMSMLDIYNSVHQSIVASRYILSKLEQDVAWYENEYGAFKIPNFEPRTEPERRDYKKYIELKAWVDKNGPGIKQAGDEVLAVVQDIRSKLVGTHASPKLVVSQSKRLADALLTYGAKMTEAEKKVQDEIYGKRLTPENQLRLVLTNESKDLIFFVRIWERDQAGNYPKPRDDTVRWLPVYPSGFSVKMETPDGKEVKAAFPNEFWMPAKLRDRIEVRVATMGPTRERIRFFQLPMTGTAYPELNSMRRNYYFLGYRTPMPDNTVLFSHYLPVKETYTWRFRGAWEAGNSPKNPEFVATNMEELTDEPRARPQFTRDHLVWYLPASHETVRYEKDASAEVSGTAEFEKRGPRLNVPPTKLTEDGSGRLNIYMEVW